MGKMLETGVIILGTGESVIIEGYRGRFLTIITGVGAAAAYSFVNGKDATAHDTPSTVTLSDASTVTKIDSSWPFIRVSATTGPVRVALV